MTTVSIEIPDDRAAVLEAKAAAEGLSLKRWLEKLTESEASHSESDKLVKERPNPEQSPEDSVVQRMRELRAQTKPDPEGWTVKDYVSYGRRQ
jgi:hypothetical protein